MDSWVGDLAHRPEKRRLKAQSLANDGLARYSLRASAIPKLVCYRIVGEKFESIIWICCWESSELEVAIHVFSRIVARSPHLLLFFVVCAHITVLLDGNGTNTLRTDIIAYVCFRARSRSAR